MNVAGVRLFIFCHFGLMASGASDGLFQLVKDLEQGIVVQSTVYYDLIRSPFLDGLMHRSVPSILIREETDLELRKHLNSHILSIVFIGTEFDDRVFSTLRKTLHRLHRTDVLFVTENLGAEENWTWLFDWCWTHGFSNVLLSYPQQPAPRLLTFYRLHSQRIRATNLSEYFERHNKWHDFQGYEVRLLVGFEPPNGIVYERSAANQNLVISGNYFQLVKLFAEHRNASLVIINTINYKSFSIFDCIEYFEAKRADFCTTVGIYDQRFRYSVAVVHGVTPLRVMVPFAKRLATYECFILPFNKSVWVALLLELCVIAMATSFFYWRCVGSCDLSGLLLQAFKGMLHLGFPMEKLPCRAKLLIYLIVFCSGFIFTNLYLAKMSSFLTAHVYEKEVDTLEDLGAKGIDILVKPTIKKIIDLLDQRKTLDNYLKVVDVGTYRSYYYELSPNYGFVCTTDCEFVMHQQKRMSRPKLRLMSEVLTYLGISIPIAHESPFEEAFNEFLLTAFSAGIYDEISLRTKEEAIREGLLKSFRSEEVENEVKPLTLEDLQVLPFVLMIGYSAALCSFCWEKLIFYFVNIKSRVKLNDSKKG